MDASEALQTLREGNERFVVGSGLARATHGERRERMIEDQSPFAAVLGCSDSRVPAEIVFDQGLGDLFVIRVAGNIVASSQVASVEFAVTRLAVGLVVVLGHTNCGAVLATLEEFDRPRETSPVDLGSITDRIRRSIEDIVEANPGRDPKTLVDEAVRANVLASVIQLQSGSNILQELVLAGRLAIVGAEYSLATGRVEFLG